MDILEYLKHPFTLGLLLGLAVAAVAWKSGFSTRRRLSRDIRKLENELRELQSHLNTQLKINAQGNDTLQRDLEDLRRQNENLRVTVATLQTKPGKAELRHFQVTENAVRMMREQAPGFAPAWEKAMRQAESELEAGESGLKKLVRRVIPGIGMGNAANAPSPGVQDADAG
jgi:DNA repair exonuclease SbcCD ATPase subunit